MKRWNAAAPTRMSGAVSPIARDSARITPVAMPGSAPGRTCFQIVCHCVAPRASEPSRIDGGTARIASRATMITTGRTSRPEGQRAGEQRRLADAEPEDVDRAADDERQAEDAVDDRRDRRRGSGC